MIYIKITYKNQVRPQQFKDTVDGRSYSEMM